MGEGCSVSGLVTSGLAFFDWKPVELAVAPGECVGLMGESGSGKTLMLRAIADLDRHAGDVSLNGGNCSEMPATEWRRQVALLPAESRWWRETVRPHFAADDETLIPILEQLGLPPEILDWEIVRLSVGERQRLGLARLLSREPSALLLDEPTANLDETSARRVEEMIREYIAAHEAPAIWVSHSRAQLERVSTRVFEMRDRELFERAIAS